MVRALGHFLVRLKTLLRSQLTGAPDVTCSAATPSAWLAGLEVRLTHLLAKNRLLMRNGPA